MLAKLPIIKMMQDRLHQLTVQHIIPRVIVVIIQLPTGAIEVIQNSEQIESKVAYYGKAYDTYGLHNSGAGIQILDFILV